MTRCQIRFVRNIKYYDSNKELKEKEFKVQIYRHRDGNPKSVTQDLKEFLEWYSGSACDSDINYVAADFIYFMKKQIKLGYGSEWAKNNYGVENPNEGIHGDEEYLYMVTFRDSKWYLKYARIVPFSIIHINKEFEEAEWEKEICLG
jgi:hypothetical protein